MADQKITQLTALASAASTDVLPIVDVANTETKKITKADLLNGLQAELVSGTNIKTINSTSLLGSGDISISANPAGTDGQIQFSDGSAFAADSNLYWDNTNKRWGVGTSSPSERLHIYNTALADLYAKIQTTQSRTAGIITQNSTANWFSGTQYSAANAYQVFDQQNNRLQLTLFNDGNSQFSISSTSLGAKLGIKGSGSTSATTSLLVQNSSGSNLFSIKDDGQVLLYSAITYLYGTFSSSNANLSMSASNGSASFGSITPNASAQVEVASTTKGFLPPRMTTTQKNAISSPAAGLQVYDSTTNRAAVYSTAWENVITETNGSPNSVYKLWSGSAAQYAALTPDANTVYFVS